MSTAPHLIETPNNTMKEEALSALVALGFNKQAAEKVLTKLQSTGAVRNVEGLIKEALKLL
jgi:Holliday junction DNA helicase RuvA